MAGAETLSAYRIPCRLDGPTHYRGLKFRSFPNGPRHA
jgi:hypothetical protein